MTGEGLISLRPDTFEMAGWESYQADFLAGGETDVFASNRGGTCGHPGCELEVTGSVDRKTWWHWSDTKFQFSGSYLQQPGRDGGPHNAEAPSDA